MQVPGVIVMEVASSEEGTVDLRHKRIFTIFNASMKTFTGKIGLRLVVTTLLLEITNVVL